MRVVCAGCQWVPTIMLKKMQKAGTAQAYRVSCPPHQSMCRHHAAGGRGGENNDEEEGEEGSVGITLMASDPRRRIILT